MPKKIKFIWIGKLKKSYWQAAVDSYLKKLSKYYAIQEVCLKDAPGSFSAEKRLEVEGEAIQKKVTTGDRLISLDSKGKQFTSVSFARCLQRWHQDPALQPCFIIGGSFGLSAGLKEKSHLLLSFGSLTLPHELARVILLEQLYRAATILSNHPYHH
ncbi:MAG: 23S rRNA (pseudouridine(1915)-N(3))-methyltransferase RlmH [Desulfohalobiaceae bacterium]|nr:23S rRNA (pseudouridine(1915)-N(3))-methyltransferase RlmH [Desulfohalobiaceae bacterium]